MISIMKKILAVCLCVIMLFSLCACGILGNILYSAGSDPTTTATTTATTTTVTTTTTTTTVSNEDLLSGMIWDLTKASYEGETFDVAELDMTGSLKFIRGRAVVTINGEEGTGEYTVIGDVGSGSYTVVITDPDGAVIANVEGDILTIVEDGVSLIFEKR